MDFKEYENIKLKLLITSKLITMNIKNSIKKVKDDVQEFKTESEVLSQLHSLLGKDAVHKSLKDYWGNRFKNEFNFMIKPLTKRYGSNVDLGSLLDDELEEKGFIVKNPITGSYVHGYIQRIVKLPLS